MMSKSFDDYILLLKEMQNAKDKTGRDINSIKYYEVVRITKINDDYEFEYFANREEAEKKCGKNVETIGIGQVINFFKKEKLSSSGKNLTTEQIKQLRDIGLKVVSENERDPIMEPKSFDDYLLLLKEMQKSKDKTDRDINSIKFSEVVRITKINDEYEFEYFANKEEAKSKYGEDVETIGISQVIYYFKRGKLSSSGKDLTAEQVKQLRDIDLKVVPESERDPIMMPKSFEDYVLLLKKIQKTQDKTGRDINDIRSKEVVRITKINDEYEFEYFANREEARKKYGKNVETIGIGTVICSFKRGKSSNGNQDLTVERVKQLKNIGLMVALENERNPIMMPKSFDDYLLLLKEMQKTQDKTGRHINSIKYSEVVRITKINDEYEFEYFANKEEAKSKYSKDVETISIGVVINGFKRGKSSNGNQDLTVEQIKQLRDIGLMVVTEKERDPIIMPKSFDDYFLLLKEMQETQEKTVRDINSIKYYEVVKITKINDEYEFEYFANKEDAREKYGEDVETIGIGDVISRFKRGKSNAAKDLTVEQIKQLRNIGLKVVPEKERDPIMMPKSFDDYLLLLKEIQETHDKTGRDINDIKDRELVRITKINDEYEFEYFANREEAKSKYGEDVETLIIGQIINRLKRGKSNAQKDLTAEQINGLRNIGLMVVPEKERDPIIMPKSFDDYILLLKEMQNFKGKTGSVINSIKFSEVVRITKINDEYEFEYFENREEAKSKYGKNVETIGIGTKINLLRNGKYSVSTYLTIDQMQTLLNIGFKFNKGIEDKIYKQEICTQHNIDLKINDKIIERISKIELISKIKYLNDKGLALVDDSGQLIDIFSMSSADIENDQRYGVSLENIINIYGKGMDRK